jgi:hypothetical protein
MVKTFGAGCTTSRHCASLRTVRFWTARPRALKHGCSSARTTSTWRRFVMWYLRPRRACWFLSGVTFRVVVFSNGLSASAAMVRFANPPTFHAENGAIVREVAYELAPT